MKYFLKVALITRTPTLFLFDPYESETRLSHSQWLRYFWSNPRLAVVGEKNSLAKECEPGLTNKIRVNVIDTFSCNITIAKEMGMR